MIFIADERSLDNIAHKLTIGGDSYALAIARLNNIEAEYKRTGLVQVGQAISIPDNWIRPEMKARLIAAGYVVGEQEYITVPTTTVTAKRDYTLYIVGAAVLVFLIFSSSKSNN